MKQVKLPNRIVEYKNGQFMIEKCEFNVQYYPYYKARYRQLRDLAVKNATILWPDVSLHCLTDLAEKKSDDDDDDEEKLSQEIVLSDVEKEILNGKEVVIVGILLKKMSCQPNILKELDDEKKMVVVVEEEVTNFVSKDDVLFLQEGDESIELKGDIKIDELCTGICLAAKGHVNPYGSGFIVDEVCFPLLDHIVQVDLPLKEKDYYIAIVSGLGFSKNMSKNQKLTRSLNLLFDILSGNSDFILDKTIVNLIIAGNCIGQKARSEEKESDADSKTPSWNKKVTSYTFDAIKLLDKFLANVGQYMHVDVMPGALDASNYLWPQQPMHPCLFPQAFRYDSIHCVTNPHQACYYGVNFYGTSGQNIDAIRSCTSLKESTDIMRKVIDWGHISPCSPDVLHSYPFTEKDPLALEYYPDVFFCGNQKEFNVGSFETQQNKTVRLISVPTFEDNMLAVLVNLRTLESEMIAFN